MGHKDANTTMMYAQPDESIQEGVEYLGSETWNDIQAGFLSDPPANGSLTK